MKKEHAISHDEHRIWRKNSKYPFEAFGAQLAEYTTTGEIPKQGDQNIRYTLELQKNRLKKKSLSMKYEFTPRGHFADTTGPTKEWKDGLYTSRMEYRTCYLNRTIYCKEEEVFNKKQSNIFYQIITDSNNYDTIGDEIYVCPNCGAPTPIKELESGCPYCGTFFKMSDLFPKTTNFYFIKDVGGTEKEVKKDLKRYMIPCMLGTFCIFLFNAFFGKNSDGLTPYTLFSIPIGSVLLGGFLGYLIFAVRILANLIHGAGKSMPMLMNTSGSANRFVQQMRQFSPAFSFEYFSGKVVSILKMILFSDTPQELSYYAGSPLGDRFQDIIESSYSGACALKNFAVQGDYCYVSVEVYMENLYDNGKRISKKDEKFCITLCKNIRKPINLHFSIQAMQCQSCGNSFNATKQKCCPSCGTPFALIDEDWVVTKIE